MTHEELIKRFESEIKPMGIGSLAYWKDYAAWLEQQLKNCNLQNVNASALIAERRKYKLEEIWNCDYEDLSDHEKFIIDNETQTLTQFFEWLHSR